LRAARGWRVALQFLHPTPFGQADPIFQRDIGFYLFRLPLWQNLQTSLVGLVVWALLLGLTVYALKGEIRPERGWKYFLTGEAKTHLCLLLAMLAGFLALGFWLDRFFLLYDEGGIIFGAGYTDVHARLQADWWMTFVTLSVAPSISAPVGVVPTGNQGGFVTLLSQRVLQSGQVRVRDEQTLLLSGIIQESERSSVTKVPILGDIPILGALFRSTETDNRRQELIVLLTPQILDDSDQSVFGYSYTPSAEVQDVLGQGSR
jgi:hypothetical protein